MDKFRMFFFSVFIAANAFAQQSITKGVIFTTGGNFSAPGNYVSVYGFDSESLDVFPFDSILGDFSNHVVVDGPVFYVHVGRASGHPLGEDRIYKYDIFVNGGTPVDSTNPISGIKSFEVVNEKLIITRAYPATSDFVKVVDVNNLQNELYSDTTIPLACNGIAVNANKAYIASTNLNDTGLVYVFDLGSAIVNEGAISVDTVANVPQKLFYTNDHLVISHVKYNSNWMLDYAGVTSLFLSDSSFATDTIGFTAANVFDLDSGLVWGDFGNSLETYDFSTAVRATFANVPSLSAAQKDPNSGNVFTLSTDYFSFGQVSLYDANGTQVYSKGVNVSGTAMDVVVNTAPVAENDTIFNFNPSGVELIDVLVNDFDIDGDQIFIQNIVKQPVTGSAAIVNDRIEFTLQIAGYNGGDTIVYQIEDIWGDTATAMVLLDFVNGINDVKHIKQIDIFPNPAVDIVIVESNSEMIGAISVLDLTGRIVRSTQANANRYRLNISGLNSGVYLIQMEVGDIIETHRLIIE